MNPNNVNTGIASKINEFSWFKPSSTGHIEGVKISAPDFSIPPTPASSYSNLHVILDTVHASTETTTRSVMAPSSFVTRSSFTSSVAPLSVPSYSIVGDNPLNDNRLDDISRDSSMAVPEAVDPEQPGARSSGALTSLKSEIAPIVPLDDYSYPESVNISLVDESAALRPVHNAQWDQVSVQLLSKNWRRNLKHLKRQDFSRQYKSWSSSELDQLENAERQWRMYRPINAIWSGRWHNVGLELIKSIGPIGFSSWLTNLKNRVIDTTMDLIDDVVDVSFTPSVVISEAKISYGSTEGAELIDFTFSKRLPYSIIMLEEEERLRRMSIGINPLLSGKWYQIGRELKASIGPIGFSSWLNSLKYRAADKTADVIETIEDVATMSTPYIESAEIAVKNVLEEGAFVGAALVRKGSDMVESAIDTAKDVLGSAAVLGSEIIENAAIVGSDMLGSLADSAKDTLIHLQATKAPSSSYPTRGLTYAYAQVDFTFKAHRTPAYIIAMEEAERLWRMSRPVSPIFLGLLHRLGLELKYKFSLRPTFASTAADAYELASGLAGFAGNALSDFSGRVAEKGRYLMDQATPAPQVLVHDFAEHGRHHLNFFAETAKPVDFTFKANRTPKYIIAMEERERSERIARGVDALLLKKWNNILSAPVTFTLRPIVASSYVLPTLAAAKEVVVEKSKGFSGFLGSLAHSVVDSASMMVSAATHSHLVETAKESLGIYKAGSIAAINKAEEGERSRRLNEKVDPMLLARLGRVQDELLHSVKSV